MGSFPVCFSSFFASGFVFSPFWVCFQLVFRSVLKIHMHLAFGSFFHPFLVCFWDYNSVCPS